MDFPLLTETVVIRGQTFKVRELTAGEFGAWAKAMRDNPATKLQDMAVLGTVEPKVTLEQLQRWPACIAIKLADVIERLSNDTPKSTPAVAESATPTG